MQSFRKMALLGAMTFVLSAVIAAPALAVFMRTGSSLGTPLAVGATVSAVNSGNVVLSGTFFGIPNTITCQSSTASGNVLANATSAGNVWLDIDTLTFTRCNSTAYPSDCTVSVNAPGWSPLSSSGDGGGLEAISSTSVRIGTGNNSINVSDCQPNKSTCFLKGLTAGPATDTGYSLSNYVTGTWTNSGSGAQLAINTAVGIQSCTATSTNWQGTYRLTAGGAQVYLG